MFITVQKYSKDNSVQPLHLPRESLFYMPITTARSSLSGADDPPSGFLAPFNSLKRRHN